jgi:hypothetical protein
VTPLEEACLARLRHVGGLRSPGEVAASVVSNCPAFKGTALGGAFAKEVRDALKALEGAGLVKNNGRGSYRALGQTAGEARILNEIEELRNLPMSDEAAKADEDRRRRRRLVLDLAEMLEGTPSGDDLLKVAEALEKLWLTKP